VPRTPRGGRGEWPAGSRPMPFAFYARLTRAQTVDPSSFIVANYLGIALTYQRRWSEARLG